MCFKFGHKNKNRMKFSVICSYEKYHIENSKTELSSLKITTFVCYKQWRNLVKAGRGFASPRFSANFFYI